MRVVGFVGPSATGANFGADCSDTINLIPEITDESSEGRAVEKVFLPTPGFIERWNLSPGPIRADFTDQASGRRFAISGYLLYELLAGFTSVIRGTVSLDGNPATICANSAVAQLFISSGDVGYCYELTTDTLTVVLASGSTMSRFMSGRFLSLDAATSIWRISDINDGLTWDPTQFAGRTGAGDPWVCIIVVGLDIILVGTESTEVWADFGLYPFPFAPRQDVLIQQGTNAPYSVAVLDNTPFWVQQNQQGANSIVQLNGYQAVKASTIPVDVSLDAMPDTSDAVAFTYSQNGHSFYVVNFPSGKIAWALDRATGGMWSKRAFWSSSANEFQSLRVQTHAESSGAHYVGDRLTGQIYELDPNSALEVDGSGIRRLRRFMLPRPDDRKRIKFPRLELMLQSGGAPATGQGSDPQAMLRLSDDNGMTFGNERWRSAGARGKTGKRVFWLRNGQYRNPAAELVMSDPAPWKLTDFFAPGAAAGLS